MVKQSRNLEHVRIDAIALFQQERISLSRASKIANIEIMDFQKLLADRGICVHYDVEDCEQDIQHLRDRAGYDHYQGCLPPLI